MAEVYRLRHLERTVIYRVLFHYFERFLAEYEGRFEKEYGYFRPIVKEVAIFRTSATIIRLDGLLRGHLLV